MSSDCIKKCDFFAMIIKELGNKKMFDFFRIDVFIKFDKKRDININLPPSLLDCENPFFSQNAEDAGNISATNQVYLKK